MTTKKQKSAEKPRDHRFVEFAIPPLAVTVKAKIVKPFTQKIIDMPVDPATALVYDRRKESDQGVNAAVSSMVGCARRRDRSKEFVKRKITIDGIETYAVWRTK